MSEKTTKKTKKTTAKTAPETPGSEPAASGSERASKPAAENAQTPQGKKAKREKAPLETDAVKDAPLLETAEPLSETAEAPLGTLSAGEETEGNTAVKTGSAPQSEPLRLPKGAFLALRKSGGLHFSSRAVVIYPDGRVAYDERGVPQKEYNRLRRAFNDGQMLSLRKLLDQINFWKTESAGQQNPDAFAYEIAARLGQRANEIEVFDGSVPENLKPLLERLTPLLPQE